MKGMLTGPVHPFCSGASCATTSPAAIPPSKIALALRDEVVDLEEAGIAAIQIDEPAAPRRPAAAPRGASGSTI